MSIYFVFFVGGYLLWCRSSTQICQQIQITRNECTFVNHGLQWMQSGLIKAVTRSTACCTEYVNSILHTDVQYKMFYQLIVSYLWCVLCIIQCSFIHLSIWNFWRLILDHWSHLYKTALFIMSISGKSNTKLMRTVELINWVLNTFICEKRSTSFLLALTIYASPIFYSVQ